MQTNFLTRHILNEFGKKCLFVWHNQWSALYEMTFMVHGWNFETCSLKRFVIRERNSPSRCVSKAQTHQKSQSVYLIYDVVITGCFQGHWMKLCSLCSWSELILYFPLPALIPLLFAVMSVHLFLNLCVSHTPGRDGTKWPGTALFHRCSVIFVVREEKKEGGVNV